MQCLWLCVWAVSVPTALCLSTTMRNFVLNEHNRVRSLQARGQADILGGDTAPSAMNMYKMKYNSVLESQAQAWAEECVWGHSDRDSRPEAGENMYKLISSSGNTTAALQRATQRWFDELAERGGGMTADDVTLTDAAFNSPTVGHWSQVVWATSTELGCGAADCGGGNFFVCCQYLPGGNYIGDPIYQIGEPCSDGSCSDYPDSSCELNTGLCLRP